MATKKYYTINGILYGEEDFESGTFRRYAEDALGSVTATTDAAGKVENTYRYKPLGGQLAKSGAAGDPSFLWNGVWGYRNTGRVAAEKYVRSRTFSYIGRWITRDTLWPNVPAYTYVSNNPVYFVDPSGHMEQVGYDACVYLYCSLKEAHDKGTSLKGIYDDIIEGALKGYKKALKEVYDCYKVRNKNNIDECADDVKKGKGFGNKVIDAICKSTKAGGKSIKDCLSSPTKGGCCACCAASWLPLGAGAGRCTQACNSSLKYPDEGEGGLPCGGL